MESLIVAFILAFVFRAYVVEAFVIPTGSMAPRLNGEHLEFTCANCGYHYRVGLERDRTTGRLHAVDPLTVTGCPLCFDTRVTEPVPDASRGGYLADRVYGDRILVLKYYYDLFPPKRWDVFVFKYPQNPRENYIKRLAGLPGEKVEVIDGNLWIDDQIERKPDDAQDALWMKVADTDYWDRNNGSRWRPDLGGGLGWQWQQMPMVFTPPARGEAVSFLTYHHLDPEGDDIPIHDFYAYDNPINPTEGRPNLHLVTDLELLGNLRIDGPGFVEVFLKSYADEFRFVLPSEGTGEQARIYYGGVLAWRGKVDPLPVGKDVTIEAANVDWKLILKVNGRRIIDLNGDGRMDESDDPRYEPLVRHKNWHGDLNEAALVKVGAAGARVTVTRLRVNRDIYYTSNGREGTGIEGHPCQLGPDEFFALGDNSPKSYDSRWWREDEVSGPLTPAVPRANLIGKAFFVYWPAAGKRYGIPMRFVPDLKAFRFIR